MTKSRFDWQRTAAIGAAAAALCGLALAAWSPWRPALPATAPGTHWQRVRPEPLTLRLGLVGRLEADMTLTVSAPFDGTIQDKRITVGQRVERDQLLYTLDTAQLDVQVRQALAELLKAKRAVQDLANWESGQEVGRARRAVATARMGLADTERKLAETRSLLDRGIVPRLEVDALDQQARQQRLDLASAQAELTSTLARGQGENLQIADMELTNATAKHGDLAAARERRTIKAPFAGVAVNVPGPAIAAPMAPVQVGSRVTPGQPLIGMASVEHLKAIAKVDEADVNQLREGLPVEVSGDGFEGLVLQGSISAVGRQSITNDTQGVGASYLVTVSLPLLTIEQQAKVRLGMSARLSIITYRNDQAVVVPAAALARIGDDLTVVHRDTAEQPGRRIAVTEGRATTAGVEVFGVPAGYVEVPDDAE